MYSIKIFLRKDHLNQDGTRAVTLRFINNRKKRYYSLRIYVFEIDWSYSQQRVKKTDKEHARKNKLITKFENKAKNIIDSFFLYRANMYLKLNMNSLLNYSYLFIENYILSLKSSMLNFRNQLFFQPLKSFCLIINDFGP